MNRMCSVRRALSACAVAALLLAGSTALAEPDEAVLGRAQGYPLGTASNWFLNPYRVGSWSALDRVPGVRTRSALWRGVLESLGGNGEE